MGKKPNGMNGSGQHHEDEKIVHFPTLAERDRARKEKAAQKALGAPRANAAAPFIDFSKIPPFTKAMVGTLLLIHAALYFTDENTRYQIFYTFGFVPAYFSGAVTGFSKLAYLGPLTHMFIHAGWMHITFNAIMALTFGILFEREFGALRTAFFWFACGLAGAGLYFILNPDFAFPVIGASGSISGLFAAAILLMNDQKTRVGLGGRGPWPLLVFWLVFMVFTGMISGNDTAWQAHAGGFVCGAALYMGMRPKRRAKA
jgi:membrane associated rhomboid family serine protease